jgi:hypothetical protein
MGKFSDNWPIKDPDEDPMTSKDAIYCSVFRGYFHPKSKQIINPNHPMFDRVIECKCKLHFVVKC